MTNSINNPQHMTLCIMAEILCITGVLINTFIVAVNLIDWMKRRSVSHVDQIICVLGVTRICSQLTSFIYILCGMLFHNPNSLLLLHVIRKLDSFFNQSSSWLMTLLSVVFCLKISNFHHVFFLRLKIMVSKKVVHFIVSAALISCCYILLLCWVEHIELPKYWLKNATTGGTGIPQRSLILLLTYLLGNSVPFLLYCTSSILVIASLSFHGHRMRRNKTPTISLEPYHNAISFIVLSLLYYSLYVTSSAGVISAHLFYSLDVIWVYITFDIFPILHSIYLIHRTNKLRDSLSEIFQHGTNCLLNRKREDPVQIILK